MHTLKAIRLITDFIQKEATELASRVLAGTVLQYTAEFPLLNRTDIPYKGYVDDEIAGAIPSFYKSRFSISGSTVLDWAVDEVLDESGNPVTGVTWQDAYGGTPVIQTWWDIAGDGNLIMQQIPISWSDDNKVTIDATGLTDLIVIIR